MKDALQNKVVVITGASIGIGREDAYKFAAGGCRVVICYYKDKDEAERTAKRCLELRASDVFVVHLNVMDNQSIKNAVNQIIEKYGEVSVLINNAGVIFWKNLRDQDYVEIEEQVRTNLEGLIKVTKECLPYVKDTIINIASGAGLEGYSELTTYCATKWGVRGFTKSLALEAPEIRVYSINPGSTATRMTNFRGVHPEKVAQVVFDVAKGRYNLPSGSDVNVWDYIA